MKQPHSPHTALPRQIGFSAQPRADGDEALVYPGAFIVRATVSVLNREPMGMKHVTRCLDCSASRVSVLNREPMGMKHMLPTWAAILASRFSAQPRADGDEA